MTCARCQLSIIHCQFNSPGGSIMHEETNTSQRETSRRDFLKASAVAGGVLATSGLMNAHAAGNEAIRVGLIGCGGRGTGAAEQCLRAGGLANPNVNVRLTAIGDAFRDR